MTTTVSTTFKNQLSEVTKLYEKLEAFGHAQHISEDVLASMNLALEEILTNIIFYGYSDTEEHEIFLRLTLEEENLIAEIEDDAAPFNPLDAPDPDVTLPIEERPIGGLGIHLTKKMMDEITYTQQNGKNILRLRKRLSQPI
jgi:serine/threonine-protein kinase RsbW